MKPPIIFVKEGDAIVEKEALVIEKECWWCKNPFMYQVERASFFSVDPVIWFECCSCGAKVNNWETLFQQGEGERKE